MRFQIPAGIELVVGSKGPIFRGVATAIYPALVAAVREVELLPVGALVLLGPFKLCVSDDRRYFVDAKTVVLPPDAWGIVASKFAEVAAGREDSPFYFADYGYLHPALCKN